MAATESMPNGRSEGMNRLRLVLLIPATLLVIHLSRCDVSADVMADYQDTITSQNPSQWLQFENSLTNSGSEGTIFASAGGSFGDDADGSTNSARLYSSSTHDVSTSTDVIAGTGALSLVFRMPGDDFTAFAYLFDGGRDSGTDDGNFVIGNHDAGDHAWQQLDAPGYIDEFAIWETVLSASDIKAQYDAFEVPLGTVFSCH